MVAGGRIKGKSTCEDFCFCGSSFTPASGPVLNPFDMTRSAGGSSCGSAVLVRRRLCNSQCNAWQTWTGGNVPQRGKSSKSILITWLQVHALKQLVIKINPRDMYNARWLLYLSKSVFFVRTKLSRLRLGTVTVMNVTVATVARYYLQVAVGDVDMALGTDNGGSVRLPSCWCGTVGLKPTFGLVPYTGIMPMDRCLDHAGPMAKTVHDCALLLEVDYCGAL